MRDVFSGSHRPTSTFTQNDFNAPGAARSAGGASRPEAEYDREVELAEWASKFGLRPADLEVFLKHGYTLDTVPRVNCANRRHMLAYLKKRDEVPPKWL